jgi:hypothetical protein
MLTLFDKQYGRMIYLRMLYLLAYDDEDDGLGPSNVYVMDEQDWLQFCDRITINLDDPNGKDGCGTQCNSSIIFLMMILIIRINFDPAAYFFKVRYNIQYKSLHFLNPNP